MLDDERDVCDGHDDDGVDVLRDVYDDEYGVSFNPYLIMNGCDIIEV